ncbi:sigma-54-dependent Fis family transcriptional regulator [Ferribacterium limneticum]|uniref:sigma-54-dependent Fis family transcriptional regulator n=1 Tax=Ferribacterium limneticum TaxID=76259 RepID=UPI001CF99540|nr:sigma-54-dependent Fis family transcriptional regulator [Ferribacterium limneticum]
MDNGHRSTLDKSIRLLRPSAHDKHRLPDIDDLAARLRFVPAKGEVWFDDRRMVLLHNSSLGAIRRELIETVGIEKARGLITRMGYQSGTRDAEMVRRIRPDSNDFDAFAVGPQMHALEGFVSVETLALDVDVETGHFYGEFIWHNSAEAEQHIATFGTSSAPVCWLQQGYANGYLSSFLGRQMLVREVECKAMGFPTCKIVGKALDQWDDPDADFRYLQAQDFVQSPSSKKFSFSRSAASTGEISDKIDLVGVSSGFNTVCHMIQRVAPTRATVLFLGESGVGKEQFARTLHNISDRAEQPFIAINCAAIPEQLIESELFGVEKGGFSGASQSRPGRFERADGGTLFLDEIGTLSLVAQGKLLRALQEGEIERIGDTRVRQVDVRVVAATNENLRDLVEAGKFRDDLFYRLNVFPVNIPPLRERKEDILLLVEHFLNRYCALHKRKVTGFTEAAIEALLLYSWPGNIRELENLIERGVILAPEDGGIDISHLFTSGENIRREPARIEADAHSLEQPVEATNLSAQLREALASGKLSLDSLEEEAIGQALHLAQGNVSGAAKILGTTRARVAYRLSGRKVAHPAGEKG